MPSSTRHRRRAPGGAHGRRPVRRQPHGRAALRGEYAAHVVDYLVTNDAKKLVDGQAMYTCACNERGTILDDLIVYRRTEDDWLVVCNASNREKMSAHFARAAKDHCDFEDQSDATALIAAPGAARVRGPRRSSGADGADARAAQVVPLPRRGARRSRVHASRAPATRARTASKIFCRWDDAPAALARAPRGRSPLGLKPAGLGARDTLRLEARLVALRQRHRRDDEPHRGRPRLGREGGKRRLHRTGRIDGDQGAATSSQARRLRGDRKGRGQARVPPPRRRRATRSASARAAARPRRLARTSGSGICRAAMSEVGTPFLVDCRGKNIEAVVVEDPVLQEGDMSEHSGRSPVHEGPRVGARAGGARSGRHHGVRRRAARRHHARQPRREGRATRSSAGKAFGTIESVKTLSDLFAPVAGQGCRSQRRPRRPSRSS